MDLYNDTADTLEEDVPVSRILNIVVPLCLLLILSVAVFANLAIMIAFRFDRKLRPKANDFTIFAIACVDFIVAVVVLPILVVNIARQKEDDTDFEWYLSDRLCYTVLFFGYTMITADIYLMVLLSWDRYNLVSKTYAEYENSQKPRRVTLSILLTITIALVPGTLELALWNRITPDLPTFKCIMPSAYHTYFSAVMTSVCSLIPISLISVLAMSFLIHLHRRLKRWNRVGPQPVSNTIQMQHLSPSPCTSSSLHKQRNQAQSSSTSSGQGSRYSQQQILGHSQIDDHQSLGKPTLPIKAPKTTRAVGVLPKVVISRSSQENKNQLLNNKDTVFKKRYVIPATNYALLLLCLIICSTPLGLYNISTGVVCPQCFDELIYHLVTFLTLSRACINPIIHLITINKIRQFYKRIVVSICKR